MLVNIPMEELRINPMTLISEDWWLITAGNQELGYNTMTASWGHMGAIWGRPDMPQRRRGLPTVCIYVRPQRYTKEFLDREDRFTLSVLDDSYRKELAYLGAHSGRDGDKIAKVGLTPIFNHDTTYFAQAKLVLICRKLYRAPLVESGFIDQSLVLTNYPQKDFHDMYVGEILEVLEER